MRSNGKWLRGGIGLAAAGKFQQITVRSLALGRGKYR